MLAPRRTTPRPRLPGLRCIMPLAVPVVEVTDEPHGLCVGSPHRESGAEDRPTSESSTVISWAPKRRQHSVSCPSWPGEVPASQTAARIV